MIELLLVVAVVGVLTYLLVSVPMPEPFKRVIIALAILCTLIYVADWFGFVNWLPPRHR